MNHLNRISTCALATLLTLTSPLLEAQQDPADPLQQLAQQTLEQVQQAGSDASLAAFGQAQQIIGGLEFWSAQALNDLNALANQAGVALDAFVPSVQGCIRDQDQQPMVGVTVLGISADFAAQLIGTTAGAALPATFTIAPPATIPVNPDWLSPTQAANWGPGCYWLPMPPGLMTGGVSALLSLARGEPTGVNLMSIVPLIPGYVIEPGAKDVVLTGEDYRIDSRAFFLGAVQDQTSGTAE